MAEKAKGDKEVKAGGRRGRGPAAEFTKARQQIFLDALSRTCNVLQSTEAAGVCPTTAYRYRRRDAEFRARWKEALEEGVSDLHALLLERARQTKPAADGKTGELLDPDLARFLLKHHEAGLAGRNTNRGIVPRIAEWQEVEDFFIAKLKNLRTRIERGEKEERR